MMQFDRFNRFTSQHGREVSIKGTLYFFNIIFFNILKHGDIIKSSGTVHHALKNLYYCILVLTY